LNESPDNTQFQIRKLKKYPRYDTNKLDEVFSPNFRILYLFITSSIMLQKYLLIFLSTAAILTTQHAVLLSPKARTGMAVDIGIKNVGNITNYIPDPGFDPCGGFPAGPIAATFKAGDKVNVKWNVTIPHASDPGVSISLQTVVGGPFMQLAQKVNDSLGAFTVTLPAGQASPNAVLHWMWQSMDDGGFYVGCSDIAITAAAAQQNNNQQKSTTSATASASAATTSASKTQANQQKAANAGQVSTTASSSSSSASVPATTTAAAKQQAGAAQQNMQKAANAAQQVGQQQQQKVVAANNQQGANMVKQR
jgi:hypothetical protein